MGEKTKKKGSISYAKWGYIFIAPFFIIFAVFQLVPLASTIYYSFFEYYRSGLKFYPADRRLAAAGGMVHRPAAEAEGTDLLQDGHLYAQPDHGLGLRHAVLRPVLG